MTDDSTLNALIREAKEDCSWIGPTSCNSSVRATLEKVIAALEKIEDRLRTIECKIDYINNVNDNL
jgi:hypothetical protein